jgi:hypothetical protein
LVALSYAVVAVILLGCEKAALAKSRVPTAVEGPEPQLAGTAD